MTISIGQSVTLTKGKQVNRNGARARLGRDTTVTVLRTEADRRGKTRVFWKSNGYPASALV